MKIDGPGRGQGVSGSKKASKAQKGGSASFADALRGPGTDNSVEESPNAGGAGGVSAVDALLALQEVDQVGDSLEERKNQRARDWGDTLIDGLEEIRNGLLMGSIPADRLERLSNMVTKQKETATDRKLLAILDDIELRTLVELAKFERPAK